ncbi:MAG: hypothetical protein GF383_14245, partial [Candidatus Lokiarchaeota archaeon]|nr:hypothetical protein [Candidatus Lokiarchaeota archaeon]MBD3342528.1 hypothetical protein [Candidatus Lokiarchaeota archaeon]
LQEAQILKRVVRNRLEENDLKACRILFNRLSEIKGGHVDLHKLVKYGIGFHHAGLLPTERKLVENFYRKGALKVICCTTTLSAGINMPARVVILKDFKRFVTSGCNIQDFTGFFENGDGFSYFKPFSPNEVFQMLGRAGRPGLDSVGYGFVLVNDVQERMWVEDHFFQGFSLNEKLLPRYNELQSGLNNVNTLKEQVLLRIFEDPEISIPSLVKFFERTYFWFLVSKKRSSKWKIPIEQLLMIQQILPRNLLKLHANPRRLQQLKKGNLKTSISGITKSSIQGYVKTQYGVFTCSLDIDTGIQCSCGFQNGMSDKFASQEFAFEFCDHISVFLLRLLNEPNEKFQKFVNDLVPKTIKNQYILTYLIEKGLVKPTTDNKLKCSQFGKLVIRLYLYPTSGVLIRHKLERDNLSSYRSILKAAYEVVKSEGRARGDKMLEPILDWADEEPLETIMERHKVMAGDLYSIKDNLSRIVSFFGIVAQHISISGLDVKDRMNSIAELSETLRIRLHYGIREELFDLVLRLDNVGRVRARTLYDAGYHTSDAVRRENPYVLSRRTGLGVNLCKSIVKNQTRKKNIDT